jgi:ribosome recycling factor
VIDELLAEASAKMDQAVAHAQGEFATIRTGRANPALLQRVTVDYYGAPTPLQQLATISVPEAQMLVVQPFDPGSMIAVEKALQASGLGLNPSNDGTVIRLSFPPLTAERRKDYVRMVKQMAEDAKVAVRNHRRSARHDLDALEKDGEISADDLERAEKELDKLTANQVAAIDTHLEHKERELLGD